MTKDLRKIREDAIKDMVEVSQDTASTIIGSFRLIIDKKHPEILFRCIAERDSRMSIIEEIFFYKEYPFLVIEYYGINNKYYMTTQLEMAKEELKKDVGVQ